MGSMKVHQFARGLFWEHEPTSLTLGCKRLRPLAPKLANNSDTLALPVPVPVPPSAPAFDLKSFIRPECGLRKLTLSDHDHDHDHDGKRRNNSPPHQVGETHPGGTRWNPTQEQIGILEMLYRGGMRTPNAQQIEQITSQLAKFGKIEGKNVFYWFQNHKARERQKQKRNSLGLNHCARSTSAPSPITTTTTINFDIRVEAEREEDSPYKRKKCRSWVLGCLEEDDNDISCSSEEGGHRTLELFPLRPEGRS